MNYLKLLYRRLFSCQSVVIESEDKPYLHIWSDSGFDQTGCESCEGYEYVDYWGTVYNRNSSNY